MSGKSYFSWATRSIPQLKANRPFLGVDVDVLEHAGDHPEPPI
jgi:hypothetical protein